MAKVLDWESGDPGSCPHSVMKTHWVTFTDSQPNLPHRVVVVRINGEEEDYVRRLGFLGGIKVGYKCNNK